MFLCEGPRKEIIRLKPDAARADGKGVKPFPMEGQGRVRKYYFLFRKEGERICFRERRE